MNEHGDFARMMSRYSRLYRAAEGHDEKTAVLVRFRHYVEHNYPGMTVRLWFGLPSPMPVDEAERLDARGPSFLAKVAKRFSRGTGVASEG